MKLYTREQMIEAFNYGKKLEVFDWIGDMIDSLTPIELPSDEDLDKWIVNHDYEFSKVDIQTTKWVIEQIKQQNETN